MKYVPMLADVVEGDLVITSGLDRIYPAGLVVGRVRQVKLGSGVSKETIYPSTEALTAGTESAMSTSNASQLSRSGLAESRASSRIRS